MPKYKAEIPGYDGVKLREIGEVFEFSGKTGKWMKPVDGKTATGKPSLKGKPQQEDETPPASSGESVI